MAEKSGEWEPASASPEHWPAAVECQKIQEAGEVVMLMLLLLLLLLMGHMAMLGGNGRLFS